MANNIRSKIQSLDEEDELKKRGYVIGPTLGEGSYAKVKAAFSQRENKRIAIKIINRRSAPKDFQTRFLPRELEIMKTIRHPNIIQLYEVMQFNGQVYLAMEVAGHGDLLEYIKLRGSIPEIKACNMYCQLLDAIEYLHKRDIVHRDLKCENILLDASNNVKLSDFGFARRITNEELSKTFCGSAAYAAPEILKGIPYVGTAYDIWSLGVILFIMVCGTMPYDDSNVKKMIKRQTESPVSFSQKKIISQDVKDLIHTILEPEVERRATIISIFNSPWVQKCTT